MRSLLPLSRGRLERRTCLRLGAAALLAGAVGLALGLLWAVARPMDAAPYLDAPASTLLLDRQGLPLHAGLAEDDHWALPVPLAEISPHLIHATLAVEDKRFRDHPGVDPWAVLRAYWTNLRAGRVVSGGSTITMQLAKRGGVDSRTIWGKIRQAWTALRLDRAVSKEAQLAAYLNTAPYGMNLRGAEAASRRYFGKPAAALTLPEAALLAGLPKSPTALMPLAHPDRARARRAHVLRRMHAAGHLDDPRLAEAIDAPLGAAWHDFPQAAPHLAAWAGATGGRVPTTVDPAAQALAQAALRRAVRGLAPEVTNGAVVVLDVATGEARAWVGSQDFFATPGGGQVDLCRAPRSPGSALKPFLYALAMQENRLYAHEILLDAVWDQGTYHPENFDRTHTGLVDAGDALRRSLNIPALTVMERMGVAPLQRHLRDLGLDTLTRAPEAYGLGLVVGNCEVRLADLAGAYATIARMGAHLPPRWRADGPAPEPRTVYTPGVARLLHDMLEHPLPRQIEPTLFDPIAGARRACWKTGTSSGNRDAWAFVFDPEVVVGVWLGNNSGRGSARLVGPRVALPLAARIFEALPRETGAPWPPAGLDGKRAAVCARSGLPASRACPDTREAPFANAQYLHRVCGIHHFAEDGVTVRTRWPATAPGWDLARLAPPATEDEAPELRVVSPAAGAVYVLTGQAGGDRVPLRSSAPAGRQVHWYADGAYLGVADADAPIELPLQAGRATVTCVGDDGARDTVAFEVVTVAELRDGPGPTP